MDRRIAAIVPEDRERVMESTSDPFIIPAERLPEGFAQRIEDPPAEPVPARPAATAVLMRDGEAGPEVLLLRRHRSSGFVPGAYVFAGGRVDAADGDARILARAPTLAGRADPEPAYWVAAAREVFEETGVLLAVDASGEAAPDAGSSERVAEWREALLAGNAGMRDVLEALDLRLALEDMVYFAHWITPVVEPRRYDTRFFLACLPAGRSALADPREMTDAVWLTPEAALRRFVEGTLPMVFPTVRTLETLKPFRTTAEALDAFRHATVSPILPRLVRRGNGVTIEV